MHPRTEELLAYLSRSGSSLAAAFEAVPAADRLRRAAETTWTPAEVMQHVALLEARFTDLMRGRLSAARAAGLPDDPATESILACLPEVKIRNRKFKVSAPAPVQPATNVGAVEALAQWRQAHDAFEAFVRESDGAALAELSHPHPVIGPLDFYQWIVFIGAHELRHADQIAELTAAMGS